MKNKIDIMIDKISFQEPHGNYNRNLLTEAVTKSLKRKPQNIFSAVAPRLGTQKEEFVNRMCLAKDCFNKIHSFTKLKEKLRNSYQQLFDGVFVATGLYKVRVICV